MLNAADMWWPAPAKLNLFLHITGRRPDGYHTLQTLFRLLDYGDQLRFHLNPTHHIAQYRPLAGIDPQSDLCLRAARLLQPYAHTTQRGVVIELDKRLPLGGGVGGGSSNAATTLVVLNQLWDCRLDLDTLAQFGLQLGADVPVFVRGQSAWAEGLGERLTPYQAKGEDWYVVLMPEVEISTATVFNDPTLMRQTPALALPLESTQSLRNDCQPVVQQRYPPVAQALAQLGPQAQLTGTGACVFRPMASQAEAEALLASTQGYRGFVARGLDHSPLQQKLAIYFASS